VTEKYPSRTLLPRWPLDVAQLPAGRPREDCPNHGFYRMGAPTSVSLSAPLLAARMVLNRVVVCHAR
jgi:hypothetical protein